VEKACSDHVQASNSGHERPALLRVDLTAQLSQDPDLVGVVRGALTASGLGAEQLWLGVPLMALARGHGDVADNVRTLAELGIRIVLVDVPADHGFLAYLEDLPVGAVEIAPDIVARVAQRPSTDSLVVRAVQQIIAVMHSADVTVVVPAVCTDEQVQWWRSAGADVAWGTHIGLPVPHFS
jgi:EAL domain-containing protein (putative c-di-GMP-specific phosphodiesterase class I)